MLTYDSPKLFSFFMFALPAARNDAAVEALIPDIL